VKALCYGFLPQERALERLQEEKERHERKLKMYEEFERWLEAQLREGAISREAYLGTLLTLRRGIGTEKGYATWCEEALEITHLPHRQGPIRNLPDAIAGTPENHAKICSYRATAPSRATGITES